MRPCNLCRQPIENRRLICEECERRNEDAGNPYKASVGLRVDESQMPNDEPVIDHSFNILMLAFDGVIAALGAMLGLHHLWLDGVPDRWGDWLGSGSLSVFFHDEIELRRKSPGGNRYGASLDRSDFTWRGGLSNYRVGTGQTISRFSFSANWGRFS